MKPANKLLTSNIINNAGKRYIAMDVITANSIIEVQLKNTPATNRSIKKVLNKHRNLNLQSLRLFSNSQRTLDKDDKDKKDEKLNKTHLNKIKEMTGFKEATKSDGKNDSSENESSNGSSQDDQIPSVYPPVMALRIYKQPLLPGLAKPLIVSDPEIVETLTKCIENNQFYVSVFLNKDKDGKPNKQLDKELADRFTSLDEVYDVGTICEISHVYESPVGRSTLLLYPHNRVKLSEIIKAPDLEERSLSDEIAKLKEHEEESDKPKDDNESFIMKENVTVAKVSVLNDIELESNPTIRALTSEILKSLKTCASVNFPLREEISALAEALDSLSSNQDKHPGKIADFAANVTASTPEEIQAVLEELDIEKRLLKALELVKQEMMNAELQTKLSRSMDERIRKRQHESLLYDQMKAIKAELGIDDGKPKVIEKLAKKAKEMNLPEHVQTIFDEEMDKMKTMEASSEFTNTRNYIEWILNIPWNKFSKDQFDVKKAREILDKKHYGMQDVKDRILEFIAVSKLQGKSKGQIICLVGPPGVGKTSIGKCIAESLNRKFYRFAVGGLSDISEIKGHRRTYIGALPGRLIEGLKQAKTMNPLIMIDEIDKIAENGIRGSPSSALLEALDPEQNDTFMDHYIDIPVDMSKVLFICTANSLSTIPRPLLDRMEVIEVSGYTQYEKLEITKRYIEPASKKKHGLNNVDIHIEDEAIKEILKGYCPESGVRTLKQHVDKIYRKLAYKIVDEHPESEIKPQEQTHVEGDLVEKTSEQIEKETEDKVKSMLDSIEKGKKSGKSSAEKVPKKADEEEVEIEIVEGTENAAATKFEIPSDYSRIVKKETLQSLLGTPYFTKDRIYEQPPVGVIPGLAAGSAGGSLLYVESCITQPLIYSSSAHYQATGSLKDVIKESTDIAYSFSKMFLAKKFPHNRFFEKANIHTHFPAGAVPKDGPSAGVTITTSLLSLALNKPILNTVAMTGEISLTGKVGAIGGLKEKTMAAKRSGMTEIIFPKDNMAQWDEIPDIVKEGIKAHPVDFYEEIFEYLFGKVTGDEGNNVWKKDFDVIDKKK
ncbi:related to Lon protease homolog, mitochondrial [Hanseniaspora guilliermondii]|uniref:Lon protease homolog n=1 Tax=Hanseniaspora guilliermondii TaxID=56406 RepID=A0A1L0CTP9_9ASCO|nr:related to Lon protease homolog, mitochondrial [Hanseniaspora guilliermondii]